MIRLSRFQLDFYLYMLNVFCLDIMYTHHTVCVYIIYIYMYLMYIICKYKDIHPSLDISVDMGCILSATKSHYKTPILYFSIG